MQLGRSLLPVSQGLGAGSKRICFRASCVILVSGHLFDEPCWSAIGFAPSGVLARLVLAVETGDSLTQGHRPAPRRCRARDALPRTDSRTIGSGLSVEPIAVVTEHPVNLSLITEYRPTHLCNDPAMTPRPTVNEVAQWLAASVVVPVTLGWWLWGLSAVLVVLLILTVPSGFLSTPGPFGRALAVALLALLVLTSPQLLSMQQLIPSIVATTLLWAAASVVAWRSLRTNVDLAYSLLEIARIGHGWRVGRVSHRWVVHAERMSLRMMMTALARAMKASMTQFLRSVQI